MTRKDRLIQLNAEINRQIDEVYAEYLMGFIRNHETIEGAAYGRQSTKDQNSIPDQIREILEEAKRKNIFIRREHIFFDAGVTGRSTRREGLNQLESLMEQRRVAAVLFFTSSRLFRKIYLTLQFVEKYTKRFNIRIIFVKNNFDSNEKESEKTLAMLSLIDQFTGTAHVDNIRAAHIGLFLAGFVVGKIHHGYQGIEVDGQTTRRNRPRRKLALLPEAVKAVKVIFHKFLYEMIKLRQLVRWLNKKSGFSPPEGSTEWTPGNVKTILIYSGYTGTFFYGKAETVYLSDKSYSLKKLRAEPLAQRHDESLRIISDEDHETARLRILKGLLGGRTPGEGKPSLPTLLKGRVCCHEHKTPLYCTGQSGGVMNCRQCVDLPAEERALYSYLPRQHATERLLETVIAAINTAIEPLIPTVVAECKDYVSKLESVDPVRRRKVEAEIASLNNSIRETYEDPGNTPEEKQEILKLRDHFRRQRAEQRLELVKIQKIEAQPQQEPSPAEVKRKLKELTSILRQAIKSNDAEQLGYANQILNGVLGEKIMLYQRGEPKSHRGWLEGRCEFRLKQYLLGEFGVSETVESLPSELVIDFRRPRPREVLKQKIYELYQAAKTREEIAAELKIGDTTVERYLNEIHNELSIAKPSKSERRKLINTRTDKMPLYLRIAPEALRLVQQGVLRGKIAELLQTNTTTLEKTMDYLREQGHDIPDGRSTNSGRKPSDQQASPSDNLGDDEETQERQAG